MGQKDFFAKLKKSEEAFEEGRKGRTGGMIEVDEGKYIIRGHSLELEVNDKGVPYIQVNGIVVHAENEADLGAKIAHREQIKAVGGTIKDGPKKGEKWEITEAEQFANVCTALKSLGFETSEMQLSDLAEVGEEMEEGQPACRVEVGLKKNGYKYIKWGKPVDDDDLPSIEDVFDGDDDDDEPADDNDEQDDDEDVDDDDEGFEPPAKGDTVDASPKGTRGKTEQYTVTVVNVKKETCSLKRVRDDKVFTNQSFDCIQA